MKIPRVTGFSTIISTMHNWSIRTAAPLAAVLLGLTACASPQVAAVGSAATTAPVPEPQRETLTVVAAGDLLVHPELTDQARLDAAAGTGYDFTKVLAAVRPVVSAADLAICHMETPLGTPDGPFTGFPIFSVPPQLADAAADTGFDTCSTSSNHSLDTGLEGVARTLDNLDRVGIKHTGTARDAAEAARVNLLDIDGVRVAQLAYTFSFNGIPLPEGAPWAANMLDREVVLAKARQARQAGADIVILSAHWGTEYQNEADVGQIGLAEQLLASPDIDLIIGTHVHVVQPFEKFGDEWVAYGMGNLITRFPDGSPENTQDAVVPKFTFARQPDGRWLVTDVEVVATWMEYLPAARVVDLSAALNNPAASAAQRDNYQRARDRIAGYLNLRDANAQGLRLAR